MNYIQRNHYLDCFCPRSSFPDFMGFGNLFFILLTRYISLYDYMSLAFFTYQFNFQFQSFLFIWFRSSIHTPIQLHKFSQFSLHPFLQILRINLLSSVCSYQHSSLYGCTYLSSLLKERCLGFLIKLLIWKWRRHSKLLKLKKNEVLVCIPHFCYL